MTFAVPHVEQTVEHRLHFAMETCGEDHPEEEKEEKKRDTRRARERI